MTWLFFGPFLIIGIALLLLAGMTVARHLAAQSWQPVQATLLERDVEVERNRSGSERVDGGTRYSARYVYQWQGKKYESTRVSLSSAMSKGADMMPDDWNERIDGALGNPGGTLTVWVDPAHPNDALVLRDIRWLETGIEIIFGLLLIWASSLFLFGYDPHAASAGFSWRTVAITWTIGMPLAVIVPLLWRDNHQVWAVLAALPLLLALYGTVYGLRAR